MPKMVHFAVFENPEACGQTVLPDGSLVMGLKLMKNVKIQKLKCDILRNFQTICIRKSLNFCAKINQGSLRKKNILKITQ